MACAQAGHPRERVTALRDHSHPQSGILNRPPEHLAIAAYAFTDRTPASAGAILARLRSLVERELTSDLDDVSATSPKDAPSAETGELGFDDNYDRAHLTITLGIAASGFEILGVAGDQRPQDLISIPWAQLGDAPEILDQGDIALQVCADNLYIVEHVLRHVDEEMGDALTLVYVLPGAQRYSTRAGRTSRREGRAMIGFLDGTGNLRPNHDEQDARLVFVDPSSVLSYPPLPSSGSGGYQDQSAQFPGDLRPPPSVEPGWTRNGSYLVVRGSVLDINRWDDAVLGGQENVIGRFKVSGASQDLSDDPNLVFAEPAFVANQGNETVSVISHARKTNPRRPEDADRRIFRRGYPLIRAAGAAYDRGLVFIAFGRTISTQFEFITRAWMKNENFPRPGAGVDKLIEFDTRVLAGGYYFAPPLSNKAQPWSWILPALGA